MTIKLSSYLRDEQAYTIRGEVYAKLKNTPSAIVDYQQAPKLFLAQSNQPGYTKATNLVKSLQQQLNTPASK